MGERGAVVDAHDARADRGDLEPAVRDSIRGAIGPLKNAAQVVAG